MKKLNSNPLQHDTSINPQPNPASSSYQTDKTDKTDMAPNNSADNAKLLSFLQDNAYTHLKPMPDGSYAGLYEHFLFTTGLMTGLTESSTGIRYCYERTDDALAALNQYQGTGDPTGPWIKAKGMGQDRINSLWSNQEEPREGAADWGDQPTSPTKSSEDVVSPSAAKKIKKR